jgi:hypothetical protein
MNKKKLTGLCILFFIAFHVSAQQEFTREQVLNLYYKAQKAEKSNNMEEAISIYKTILTADSNLPTPYLKMANIYAANEGDPASAASAIALYKKYLSLNPSDKNAEALNNKITQLQAKAGAGSLPQDDGKIITEMLETGKQPLPETVKPAEPSVASGETNLTTLWTQANEAIAANNTNTAIGLLDRIVDLASPNHPLYAQSNILLAKIYGDNGDAKQMQNAINALESYVTLHEQVLTEMGSAKQTNEKPIPDSAVSNPSISPKPSNPSNPSNSSKPSNPSNSSKPENQPENAKPLSDTTVKSNVPFEDDLCGVWVSDYSYDKNGLPYIALEIVRDDKKEYSIEILPYCTLASQFPLKLRITASDSCYRINGKRNQALFYFGGERFKSGSEFLAKTQEIATVIKPKIGSEKINAMFQTPGVDLLTAVVGLLFAELTVSKKSVITIDMELNRLFAGCVDLEFKQTSYQIRSDDPAPKSPKPSASSGKTMKLFKLYPSYNVTFIADVAYGYQLFGYKKFSKYEILNSEEYKYVTAIKDRKDFNRQSYKKLSEKVIALCKAFFPGEQGEGLAQTLQERFEFATQGLSYQTIDNSHGTFKGWMDMSGKLNGYGYCSLVTGHEYVGDWKDNKHSGMGKLTMPGTGVYSGGFVNGKFQNAGILSYDMGDQYNGNFNQGKRDGKGAYTFANGDMFNGIWKNDKPQSGVLTYTDGNVYDGQVQYEKQWKKEGKGKMTYANGDVYDGDWKNDARDGNGSMIYADKKVANGKWKNGEFIPVK